MHEGTRSRAASDGVSIALASEMCSPEGDTPKLSTNASTSDLLLSNLLPLIGQVRTEARTLGNSGRRGDLAEHATRIDELAAEAEASTTALARFIAFEGNEQPLDLAVVDLGDVLMTLLARWKTRAPSHAFELALPGEIPLISADVLYAEAALDALIEDAVALTATGGEIRVSIRPVLDAVEVALRPQTALTRRMSIMLEDVHGVGEPRGGEEPSMARARINFSLARAIVARHGGRVHLERDSAAASVTLRASWPFIAQAEEVARPRRAEQQPVGEIPRSVAAHGARQTALVWEPDARMARYLRSNLEVRQFRPIMASALEEVPHLIEVEEPDMLVLDVTSEERVTAIIERVARMTQAPMLLLAAEYDAEVCARLLDLGASDYLAKPLHIDELFARMRAALRARRATEPEPRGENSFHSGELTIDFAQRRVTVGESEIALSKTEFKLLRTLAQNAGKVLSHDWLLDRVWGAGYRHETEFIWVYVRRLRRKIEPDPKHPRYVITVPGVGYRLAKT